MSPTPSVRVGVGAFVLAPSGSSTNPRFLIGKRKNSHGSGTYALPGGHLEFGETPEACAVREVKEETGLDVHNVRFLTATNDYMAADNKHYVTLFMVCERVQPEQEAEVLEPEKCEGWEWISWAQLQEGETAEKRFFTPILNLLQQRPGVLPTFS
ncbi:hypothetical protein MPDQ_004240 [Monascus purpureus]|uniref:Nudix hydrolase domain-containing protein n=1 Tax=Monascus purpureus TaxID=5098 RepID=A0A507QY29_MONPU|nr:hypothetical protein MPDQ_004240 [Monascus purpureus]BDD63585.1 hypothetical protein MAP00_008457 [Monascus purpureus]